MWQNICHHWTILGSLNSLPTVWMQFAILGRTPYPEWNLHLVASQSVVDAGRVHSSVSIWFAVENLLAMIWHIDYYSILIYESLCYSPYYRVVVSQRVVVMSQNLQLTVCKFWTIVHLRCKVGISFLWIASTIVYMRTLKMQYRKVMLGVMFLQYIVLPQHSFVVAMQAGVAGIKLIFAQFRIVQEETTTKVVNLFACFRLELVGDKRNVITCLAEHFCTACIDITFLNTKLVRFQGATTSLNATRLPS